ncbi:centromere protein F [Engystomops pustulosus]|uniref:centromere protein F n=1 Tax=Engystomops pustulosus TaxID=76066 RepID=UPI003AFB0771
MSWVVEEWKEGLPTKTLQKIQELEGQLDKLKKERQQKQFQLESLEAAFQKQKQKVESEKSEVTALKRENQSLIELCDNQEKTRQKLSHEQQVKDTQINFLEGQLSASKKHIEKLEQELKRYKNDLERNQQSCNTADMSLCVTPQKSFTAAFTPVKFNDSKYEELQEKYNKEVEERKRLETELKILQIKLVNQTPQPAPQNTMNHRDIARHQSSSSVFSWQQERTPSRSSSSSLDTSLKRNYTSIQYPWEQEETPSKRGLKSDGVNRSFSEASNNPANDQLRNQNQELRSKVNELELRLQVQEKELKSHLHKMQETQTLLDKTQAELAEKDKTLTKSRDDLARVTAQFEQSVDKCTSAEQKLKKVSEELSCQRQNAESARLALEHRLKEQEKESQQELLQLQNSLKNMEQQLDQTKTKLSQESQQAKNEYNALRSELDRVTHGKKVLENEVEDIKQKLSRAEQAVTTAQGHVTDLKKELEEARSQQNTIRSQLDHKTRETAKLEEEFRTTNQTLRQNQVFIDELKNKNNTLEAEMKTSVQKRNHQDSTSLENLKAAMTNLEKERDFAKDLLQKRESDLTDMKSAQAKMSEELSALKDQLHGKDRECQEKEEMSRRIKDLETTERGLTDQVGFLHTQIKTLQDIIDVRTSDLEVQKVNCANLNGQIVSESQKHQKEMENLLQKISELEEQRKTQEEHLWSNRVSFLENELEMLKKLNAELQGQHDLLVRNQQEIQERVSEVEEKNKGQLSNSTNSPDVDCTAIMIREKDEEICKLSEELRRTRAEMEAASQDNRQLKTKLQELTLLSDSWSTEREMLAVSINSLQNDMEKLTEENKRLGELCNVLKSEKTPLKDSRIDTSEQDPSAADDRVDEDNKSRRENLLREVAEWKEKVGGIQQENSRLLRANEELSTLIGKLRENECSLNKSLEELRVCLKDKEMSVEKLELHNKSCKEDSVQEQLINLQTSPDNKVPQSLKEKKTTALHSLDETAPIGNGDGTFMDNSLLDLTEDISLFTSRVGTQNREENLTLLMNMDQLTLASANDPTLPLPDLSQLVSHKSAILSPFTSPPVKESRDRRSITGQIVDLLLQQSPSQQQQQILKDNESEEMKDLLMAYQMELSRLQKEHLSEIATWQQKLKDQASEMETRLLAEKSETERLTQELEAARVELQVFDLSARSLLSFDNDDLTTKLDAANQTICTVLPIGSLSLSNSELSSLGHLKKSPKAEKKGVDENITELEKARSPMKQKENMKKPSRERKRRKGRSGGDLNNVETHEGREDTNQKLEAEIKDLSSQIETLKAEIVNRDQEKQDLNNKTKQFEVERLELLEQIELVSIEKLRSANKIVELEKDLNDSSNSVEILKRQITELSSVRESLEISEKEWKENYLQTESELRRAKSEKANIENHAMSLEADLDGLQCKCQRLQEESEGHVRSLSEIRENLNAVVAEKGQLNQELESLVEEKEDLEKMYNMLKVREEELESSKLNSKELIKILEVELRALKEELKTAKSTVEQLTAERDSMVDLQESEKTEVEELQNEIQRIREEQKALVSDQEDLQVQISTLQAENEKLSKSLDRSQREKRELGSSLTSAQEEVTLMRTGIEKLKVKIEADEKKKRQSTEKLRESERKFDKLSDKIESLERELLMSEENLENAILQAETSKEEVERVKEQKEALEIELKCLRKKLEELEEALQRRREKIDELEAKIATITKTLEDREMEYEEYKDNSERQYGLLQVELEELLAQKALSDQKYESAAGECADVTSKMKEQKEHLMQELEKAQKASSDLEMSLQKVTLEQEECKVQLDEKTRQLTALEGRMKDAERSEMTFSSEVSQFAVECENLRNKNKTLQATLEELEETVHTLSAENEALQSTVAGLQTSCSGLEAQMESSKTEKQTLLDKVAELEDNCTALQRKLQDADLHIKGSEEQNRRERRELQDELQAMRRQQEDRSAQLQAATSEAAEMEKSLTSLQKEMESHKDEIREYEERLLQAESRHRSLLDEMRAQEGDLVRYREKTTSLETQLNSGKQEIDRLKIINGELSEALSAALQQLQELKQLEVNFDELKKENAKTCSDLSLSRKSCKEMEEEKEQLQQRIVQQEETLRGLTQKQDAADMNGSDGDLLSELEELRQCLEEKTQEADESVEKYCNLLIKTHKLEDANEALRRQVDLLGARLREQEAKRGAQEAPMSQGAATEAKRGAQEAPMSQGAATEAKRGAQEAPMSQGAATEAKRGAQEAPMSQGAATEDKKRRRSRRSTQGKQQGKRQREAENTELHPSTPQALIKRVRKTQSHSLEEEIEPEGLPDVVKKGFADIPSGKQSPYVLRRTAVPVGLSPRLSSQTSSPSVLNARIDNLENISDLYSPTPGGSKHLVTKTTEDAAPMGVLSPLSAYVNRKSRQTDNLCAGEAENLRTKVTASHDDTEEEGQCQVQ